MGFIIVHFVCVDDRLLRYVLGLDLAPHRAHLHLQNCVHLKIDPKLRLMSLLLSMGSLKIQMYSYIAAQDLFRFIVACPSWVRLGHTFCSKVTDIKAFMGTGQHQNMDRYLFSGSRRSDCLRYVLYKKRQV